MRRASTTLDANIGLPPKFANLARGTIARRDSERAEHRDTEALLMSVLFRHQDLLEGKDALICEQEILSEADHRGLLDSLQMIVSVLSQQSWTEKDAKVTSRLSVAANRVGAIAGLHLHHSLEGAQTVDFRQYLDELCRLKREEIPQATNVYPELGAIFAGAVLADNAVERVGHLLGKLVTTFGADHILWGTDSIWYGSPQWQIDALKTFQMPQSMMDEFGYPQITPDIKRRIFGLNAADVYGLDPEELRCTLPNDLLGQAKVAYQDLHDPSLRTYGPRTRREFLQLAFGGRPDPRHRG